MRGIAHREEWCLLPEAGNRGMAGRAGAVFEDVLQEDVAVPPGWIRPEVTAKATPSRA